MSIAHTLSLIHDKARWRQATRSPALRRTSAIAGLAALYFIIGKLGLALAFINASATAVWPPTGVAIAALLLFGYELWPGVFAGAFFVNLATAGTAFTSFAIATGNTLEALTAVYLVNTYANGKLSFERAGDVFRFAVFAGAVSTAIAATVGVASVYDGGFADLGRLGQVWFTWWLGDAGGALIVAPFLILWGSRQFLHWTRTRAIEIFPFAILLVLMGGVVFEHWAPFLPLHNYPISFLVILPLVWAAFRIGRRATATAMLVLAVMAIAGTLRGFGPFVLDSPNESLIVLQVFLTTIASAVLMFAALALEQTRAVNALALSERRFRALIEKSSDAVTLLDAQGKILYASHSTQGVCGYEPAELVGRMRWEIVLPEEQAHFMSTLKSVAERPGATVRLELRIARKDREVRWIEGVFTNALADPAVGAVILNFRDITERKELAAAKSNFISSISSRLRPPLAEVETYLVPLLRTKKKLSALEQKYLEGIGNANRKMISLTDDLMRLMRLELGTISVQPKPTNMRKLMDDAIRGLAEKFQPREITVLSHHDRGRMFLVTDPNLLSLSLQRLLSQVAELLPRKSVIDATLVRGDSDIQIRIAYPRSGTLRHGLQAAADLEAKPREGIRAPALGLYVVRSLIELLGGTVHFEPSRDENETLSLVFPHGGPREDAS